MLASLMLVSQIAGDLIRNTKLLLLKIRCRLSRFIRIYFLTGQGEYGGDRLSTATDRQAALVI